MTLIDYMFNGGTIESIKRGDIAYYSIIDKKYLLRYNKSSNNINRSYDNIPVQFDFKFISTFKKSDLNNKFDDSLKIPLNRKKVEPKQVIIVNKNLNMSIGKLAAQVSHASLGAFLEYSDSRSKNEINFKYENDSALEMWINKRFTKIVLYVKSEEKLKSIFKKAKEANLPCSLIEDSGFTEFDQPTFTCVGIGPVFPDDLIGITDKLRVL